MPKFALISLFDTSNVIWVATELNLLGWKIIATEETFSILKANGIPFIDIKDYVSLNENYKIPPTLHPKIESALTDDSFSSKIDIVFDIPYPIENGIDVGGHTLLALALKGDRVPVTTYKDIEEVIYQLKDKGTIPGDLKRRLQNVAFLKINHHSSQLLSKKDESVSIITLARDTDLQNGENPYQIPAYINYDRSLQDDPYSLKSFERVSGNKPCYTNIADMDSLLNTLYLASKAFYKYHNKVPYISIAGKHGNACGMAVSWESPENTIEQCLWANPIAVWGGEFVANYSITKKLANLIKKSERRKSTIGSSNWMLNIVCAADIDEESLQVLGERKNSILFKNISLHKPEMSPEYKIIKQVKGGFLTQPPYSFILDINSLDWIDNDLSEESVNSIIISWAVAYTSFHGGNEVAIASGNKLISAGGGPSTVEAAQIAVWRAKNCSHGLENSAFAADAFFPFTDAPGILLDAGCRCGVVPAGGVKHDIIKGYFQENNLNVGFISEEYRGFCRH